MHLSDKEPKPYFMKILIMALAVLVYSGSSAQNNTAANIIEGGKTLVELVRVFKTPRTALAAEPPAVKKTDSCIFRNTADICFTNVIGKPLLVSISRRNGNTYETAVLSLKILPKNQECLYELKAGVYKIKLETEENGIRSSFREGEIKLNPCEHVFKEIKTESL